jgi:hypothetical protein
MSVFQAAALVPDKLSATSAITVWPPPTCHQMRYKDETTLMHSLPCLPVVGMIECRCEGPGAPLLGAVTCCLRFESG